LIGPGTAWKRHNDLDLALGVIIIGREGVLCRRHQQEWGGATRPSRPFLSTDVGNAEPRSSWNYETKKEIGMKSSYRWVIVACGALMTCVGIGAMFSLAVYLQPMSVDTGWSRTGISSAMTLDFLVMGAAGFGWGALSDRIGPRVVVLAGAVLLGLGLVLASGATSLLQFQLTYGFMVGLASGAFFAPMIAAATDWFEDNRSLAVSLVSAGMGVDDHLALCALADLRLRLAHRNDGDRDGRLVAAGSGCAVCASCAQACCRWERGPVTDGAFAVGG
jgi:Major Facilitator Superfamily